MDTELIEALEKQRTCIRANWENLLRIERISSPLANPDTLVHLLDTSLNEVLAALRAGPPRRLHTRLDEPLCPCGRNPLLAYFSAGRQALREALVLAQALRPQLTSAQRDESLAALEMVYGQISRREIQAFCSICQYRVGRENNWAGRPATGHGHGHGQAHAHAHSLSA